MSLTPNTRLPETEGASDRGCEWVNRLVPARFTQSVEGRKTKTNHELRAHNRNLRQSELARRTDKITSRNARPHMPHLDEWKKIGAVNILQGYAEIRFEEADKIPIGIQTPGIAVGDRIRIEATTMDSSEVQSWRITIISASMFPAVFVQGETYGHS